MPRGKPLPHVAFLHVTAVDELLVVAKLQETAQITPVGGDRVCGQAADRAEVAQECVYACIDRRDCRHRPRQRSGPVESGQKAGEYFRAEFEEEGAHIAVVLPGV
jgi:hypothetical protein